jgi:hypothetical protein
VPAKALVEVLRQQRTILPTIDVIERVCSEALTRGTRQAYVYEAFTAPLNHHHRSLDSLFAWFPRSCVGTQNKLKAE